VFSGTTTATGTYNLSVTATDNDGISNSDSFTLTVNADSTPNAYSFTDLTNQSFNTLIESDTVTISGINTTSPVTIIG